MGVVSALGNLGLVETWPGGVAELPGELPGQVDVMPPSRSNWAAEVGVAAITGVVLAILGAGVGAFWAAVGPHVAVVITADGPNWKPDGGDEFFAGEGAFALIAIAVGLLSGIAGWALGRRWRGPILLAGLAVGGFAGALVAWQVGKHVGLSAYQDLLKSTDVGREFNRPVEVRSKGMLLLQPLAAVVVYVWLACWKVQPDLRA